MTSETNKMSVIKSVSTWLEPVPVVFPVLRFFFRTSGLSLLRFMYNRRAGKLHVPSELSFGSEAATRWFTEKLVQSQLYVEFGSGGSTYVAAKLKKPFVTIESDKFYLRNVEDKIKKDGFFDGDSQNYIHRDVGITRTLGYPLLAFGAMTISLRPVRRFSDFPLEPVDVRNASDLLVLVDGRFRVACALKALRALKHYGNWTLIFDDYVGRPYYEEIEKLIAIDEVVGRMAIVRGPKDIADGNLAALIRKYERDPR